MRERILVVDVETCGQFGNSKVYDFGCAVVERTTGRIIETLSAIIPEVFYGMARDMASAYYADKLPQYHAAIYNDEHEVIPFLNLQKEIHSLMAEHKIQKVYAYNCAFDRSALDNTTALITKGNQMRFFPTNTVFCDIWHIACQTILNRPTFRSYCEAAGFISDAGNYRTSAEVAYGYLTNNAHFKEEHTGLSDVLIEVDILSYCLRQKKKFSERIIANPWRIPQRKK